MSSISLYLFTSFTTFLPRPYLSSIYGASGSVNIQLNIFPIPFSPSRVSLASPYPPHTSLPNLYAPSLLLPPLAPFPPPSALSLPPPPPLPSTWDSKRHCHPFQEECRVTPRHGVSSDDDSWPSALLSFFLSMFNCLDNVPVSISSVCFIILLDIFPSSLFLSLSQPSDAGACYIAILITLMVIERGKAVAQYFIPLMS